MNQIFTTLSFIVKRRRDEINVLTLNKDATSISSEAFERKKVKESKIIQWTKKITNNEISLLILLLSYTSFVISVLKSAFLIFLHFCLL